MYGRNFAIFVTVCLVAHLLCSAHAAEETRQKKKRIINGQIIDIAQAPYIVQLRFFDDGRPLCGGTLVTSQHVVTAAHCFGDTRIDEVAVVGGANTLTDAGVLRRIAGIIKPSSYTKQTLNGDLAILKLDRPMTGTNIRPVPLCSVGLLPGSLIQVSGWGYTTFEGEMSNELRTIRIPTIARQKCQAMYGSLPITQYMLCALSDTQDSCQGDSGGPAIFNGQLCGVVSFGTGCASGSPGVYTDISALRVFIQNAINSM